MKSAPFITALFIFLLSACGHQRAEEEQATADSLISRETARLFTNPRAADSALAVGQASLRDTSVRMMVEVYRATAAVGAGDTTVGRERYKRVEEWCGRHPEATLVKGILFNHYGVNASLEGNTEKAQNHFEAAYDLLNRDPKRRELIATTVNLADLHNQRGRLPQSAAYYRHALFLCDSLGVKDIRNAIYSGLGQVYMELQNFPLAHTYFHLASHELNVCDIPTRYHYSLSLGTCSYYEGLYDEAINCFCRAEDFARQMENDVYELYALANQTEIYLIQENIAEASRTMDRINKLIAHLKSHPESYRRFSPVARTYIESLRADLAISRSGFKDGTDRLKLNFDSLMADSPRYLMLHYRRLENYARKAGDYRSAYEYQAKSRRYADSLYNSMAVNNVAEMAQRYSRDTTLLRQQVILSEYQSRNVRQQAYIIGGLLLFFLIAVTTAFIIFLYRRRMRRRLHIQMNKMTALRMDIVRNRVSPHYIFNVLGTVLPRLRHYPDLAGPMEMLIDVLRGNLLASGNAAVALSDEIALVERYVGLQRYSRGERPKVTWHIADGLRESTWPIPSMSLQIPVENAFKHAFPELTDESEIVILIEDSADGLLHLSVTDNGCGYNPGKIKPTGRDTGTGLRLLSQTLAILNGINRREARFSIHSLKAPLHGTQMEFYLPRDYNYELPTGGEESERHAN